jgi:hypothetical protein
MFEDGISHDVNFVTADLEAYDAGEANTTQRLERAVDTLLMARRG